MNGIVLFTFKYSASGNDIFCFCKLVDYQEYGFHLVNKPGVLKGVSDVKDEAMDDFKFNLNLGCDKQTLEYLSNSTCRIEEKQGGVIPLN